MINELTNDEIEELVGINDIDKNMLSVQKNGLLLTTNQVDTLKRHSINIDKCSSLSEILYMLDDVGEDEELEALAQDLAERNYYENTHK